MLRTVTTPKKVILKFIIKKAKKNWRCGCGVPVGSSSSSSMCRRVNLRRKCLAIAGEMLGGGSRAGSWKSTVTDYATSLASGGAKEKEKK